MNRAAALISAAAVVLLCAISGCSSSKAVTPVVPPPQDAPHVVTDLSTLSPADPLNPFGKHDIEIARRVSAEAENGTSGGVAAIGADHHVGDDKHPGEVRLLNKKAAQFPELSIRMLDEVFGAMEEIEDHDEISHLKLPTDLRSVIITATLDSNGKLRDLLIEQHSGQAAVDRAVVKACRSSLFLLNPPPAAAISEASGAVYKVKIEARLENFASLDGEHWEFKTFLGLAML